MASTDTPTINHFYLQKPTILQTDTSGCVITGIVDLYIRFGILWPVNIYSPKWSPVKQNYNMYDQ